MSSSPSGPGDHQEWTVRDVFKAQRDQAFHLGEFGFTSNSPNPEEIFKTPIFNPETSMQPPQPAEDETAIVEAMQSIHRKICKLQEGKAIMDHPANNPLLAETVKELDEELLEAGKSQRYVVGQTLRRKVVDYAELREPKDQPNFVTVKVLPMSGQGEIFEVSLPLKATIPENNSLLWDVCTKNGSYLPSHKEKESYMEAGTWKYQLTERNSGRPINKLSTKLEIDWDYHFMIQLITTGGLKAPVAALCLVGSEPVTAGHKDMERDAEKRGANKKNDFVLLDKDGNPFFDDIDEDEIMERIGKNYAERGDEYFASSTEGFDKMQDDLPPDSP